jgi:hypothetical protein
VVFQSDINQLRWNNNLKDLSIHTATPTKCKYSAKYSSAVPFSFAFFPLELYICTLQRKLFTVCTLYRREINN